MSEQQQLLLAQAVHTIQSELIACCFDVVFRCEELEATPPLDISTKNYKLILLAVPVSDEVFVPSVTSPPLASSRAPAPAPAPAPPLRSTPSSLPELERSSSNAPHPPPLDTAPESKSSHNHTPPNQRNGKSPPAVTPPPSSAPGPISTATAAIGPLLNARSSPPTTPQTEDDGLDGEAEVAAILNTPVPARSQPTTPIQPSQKSSEIPPPPPPPPAVRAANRSGSQTQTQSQAVARAESPLLFGAGSLSPPQPPQPPAPIPTAVLHPPLRPPSLGAAAATIVAPRQSASQQASSPTIPYSSTPLTAPQHTPSQPSTPVVAATAAAAAQPPPNATSGPVTGVEAITKTKPRKSKKAAREFAAAAAAALSVDSSTGRGARSSRSSADWHRALEQAPIIKSWQVGETAPEEQWRFYTKEHKSEWLRDKQDTTTEMTPVHRRALNLFDAENSTQWKSGKHVRKATDTKLYFSLLVSSVPRDLSASPDSDDKKSAPKGSVDTLMAAFAFQIRRKVRTRTTQSSILSLRVCLPLILSFLVAIVGRGTRNGCCAVYCGKRISQARITPTHRFSNEGMYSNHATRHTPNSHSLMGDGGPVLCVSGNRGSYITRSIRWCGRKH